MAKLPVKICPAAYPSLLDLPPISFCSLSIIQFTYGTMFTATSLQHWKSPLLQSRA